VTEYCRSEMMGQVFICCKLAKPPDSTET